MLAEDKSKNQLLELITVSEETAVTLYQPITVCLVVVKIGNDYLFGYNHWRKCWEIFGGCIEKEETLREAIIRESKEELGIERTDFTWLGLARFHMKPDYFSPNEREEFGAIFAITLSESEIPIIKQSRIDREEIERVSLLKDIPKSEEVRALDKKLTEYYL